MDAAEEKRALSDPQYTPLFSKLADRLVATATNPAVGIPPYELGLLGPQSTIQDGKIPGAKLNISLEPDTKILSRK